ncbi:MAG: CHASE3 domain-containing protein, partial [Planctomycetaceae bacterium]|nr:CHASE3 domain-containing protein [Planctomycetaceae bacterium]
MKPISEPPRRFEIGALLGAGLVIVVLAVSALVTQRSIRQLYDDAQLVTHSQEVFNAIDRVLSLVKDAETGQRGYLLTGEARYLEPYDRATAELPEAVSRLESLTADNPTHRGAMPQLRQQIEKRMTYLRRIKEVRDERPLDPARDLAELDLGKAAMDALRTYTEGMRTHEETLMRTRAQQSARSFAGAIVTSLISLALGLASVAGFIALVNRNLRNKLRAAADVHRERERFEVTLRSIGDGVIATDTDGRVTFLNQIAATLTGWPLADAAGQPLEKVFHIVNEETRAHVENPALRALQEGTIVGLANHTALIHRDGSERAIADSAAPIRGLDGQVLGAVLVFRDVDEERAVERTLAASEARKRAILETALDCIITCDHEGRVVEFNPAAERTFGFRREEILGRDLGQLIVPERLRAQHREAMQRQLATGDASILNQRIEL